MPEKFLEIAVEDGTIVNLATSNEKALTSKRWIAVVTRDMSKPGTLDRQFLDAIDKLNRGRRCKLPKNIGIGTCLEMAVKDQMRAGSRTQQLLFRVEGVHPERLIVSEIKLGDVSKTSAIKPVDVDAASGVQVAHNLIDQLKQELKGSQIALAAALAVPAFLEASRAKAKTLTNHMRRQFDKLSPELKENEILTKVFADLLLLQQEVKMLDVSPEKLSANTEQE